MIIPAHNDSVTQAEADGKQMELLDIIEELILEG